MVARLHNCDLHIEGQVPIVRGPDIPGGPVVQGPNSLMARNIGPSAYRAVASFLVCLSSYVMADMSRNRLEHNWAAPLEN